MWIMLVIRPLGRNDGPPAAIRPVEAIKRR
jgi:hypothetical protein